MADDAGNDATANVLPPSLTPKYIRLIAADGHEFIVREEIAFLSPTIVAMMNGPTVAKGECHLTRIPSNLLSIVVRYLYYKKMKPSAYWLRGTSPPSFDVPSTLRVDASYAADFLGLISNSLSLWEAVYANDLLSVCALLNKGKDGLEELQEGRTPLELAAECGFVQIAEELLRAGASTHLRGILSALHFVCLNGHLPIVRLLVAHGADINERDVHFDDTPLIPAVQKDAIDIIRFLLAKGADPHLTNRFGRSAMYFAKSPEVVRLLLAHGLDINQRSSNGHTPLIHNAMYDKIDTVRCLLQAGADPLLTDVNGESALDLAHDPAIVRLLEEHLARH